MASSFDSLRSSRRQQLRVVDRRVRLITEILGGIRQVKLFAYEDYFGRRILDHREKELARLRRRNREKAVLDTITVGTTSLYRG
jgi:ATP-binding cassette subfamily C (CFTR/MRP) protein 1